MSKRVYRTRDAACMFQCVLQCVLHSLSRLSVLQRSCGTELHDATIELNTTAALHRNVFRVPRCIAAQKKHVSHCMPRVCRSAYDAVYVRARVAERRASTLLTYFKSAYLPACSEITHACVLGNHTCLCARKSQLCMCIHIYK